MLVSAPLTPLIDAVQTSTRRDYDDDTSCLTRPSSATDEQLLAGSLRTSGEK
jgi:hypothetical protein